MKKMIIIVGVLIAFLLGGCVSQRGIIESQKKANEALPTIRYKSKTNEPFGQMAAIYGNYLYYCDKKTSGTGIYKYDLLNDEEELIIEVENIRKIQITEKGIYYIGRTPENDIEKNDLDGQWNTYQLFFHEGHGKNGEKDRAISESVYAWDFFVSDKEIFFVTIESVIPTGKLVLRKYLLESNGAYLTWQGIEVVDEEVAENISIYENAELAFGLRFTIDEEEEQFTKMASVYEKQSDGVVYVVSDRIYNETHYPYMLLGSYEEDYLCTEDNQIFLVNKNGISRQTTIEQVEKIIFGFKQENQMYLIGEQENKESIHLLNLDTFNVEMIQELEKNEKAVAMTDRGLICVTPKEINLRDMQTGEIIQSQQLSKKINLDKNTVEVAGDYIFVYEYDDGITIREKQQLMWQ